MGGVSDEAKIVAGPVEVEPDDGLRVFSFRVKQGETVQNIEVAIPEALMASPPSGGAGGLAVATKGRSAVEESLGHGQLPNRITLDPSGSSWSDPPG
jgi:hypothetical protein